MKKKIFCGKNFFIIAMVLLVLISGCKGKKDAQKAIDEIRTGSEGIVMSFLPNSPPDKVHVEQNDPNEFDAVLELKNKGAFPQPEDRMTSPIGNVYLSGYDRDIITFTPESFNLNDRTLEGKSTINPNGGLDLVTFKGKVIFDNLKVEKYDPILLATACYTYNTIAGPSVCIDPNPYSTSREKKVCEVQPVSLSNQGAPVAVTRIDEEAYATKTQFKITIKNVGGGEAVKSGSLDKCGPSSTSKLGRDDIDKVQLESVQAGNKLLTCRPFVDGGDGSTQGASGFIRLINGEGFIICEFLKKEYEASKTAFTTPLKIKLNYIYRTTAEKKIQIKKETSGTEITPENPPVPSSSDSQPFPYEGEI